MMAENFVYFIIYPEFLKWYLAYSRQLIKEWASKWRDSEANQKILKLYSFQLTTDIFNTESENWKFYNANPFDRNFYSLILSAMMFNKRIIQWEH